MVKDFTLSHRASQAQEYKGNESVNPYEAKGNEKPFHYELHSHCSEVWSLGLPQVVFTPAQKHFLLFYDTPPFVLV